MTDKKDGRSTNSNKAIQEKKEYWDNQMLEIKRLVTMNGFRMKDLAKHFDCTASSIATVLHRRGISLVGLRHNFAKEQGK